MSESPIRFESTQKRIRAYFGGDAVADSTDVLMVWEKPYYPVYYFPVTDVRQEMLTPSGTTARSPSRGTATMYNLKVGDREATDAAYGYTDPKLESLADRMAFVWDAMDHWFEEDEEVFVHARDPYTRVDVLPSSRHVRVELNGVTMADSTHARILFETGLPARYYLPKPDVRMDLLTPTATRTQCPYKGTARYWSVEAGGEVFEDIVWGYQHPVAESTGIAGLLCFFNEKTDIYVDGELEERPKTVFS